MMDDFDYDYTEPDFEPEIDERTAFALENRYLLEEYLKNNPTADKALAAKAYAKAVSLWFRRYRDAKYDFSALLYWQIVHQQYTHKSRKAIKKTCEKGGTYGTYDHHPRNKGQDSVPQRLRLDRRGDSGTMWSGTYTSQ